MPNWRDTYMELFESGKRMTWKERVIALARFEMNRHKKDSSYCIEDALCAGFEDFELMSGHYIDPTVDEYDELLNELEVYA